MNKSFVTQISLKSDCKFHDRPVVLAIGNFDGVHSGHRYLLTETIKRANELQADPCVLTFYPHTRAVIFECPKLILTSQMEKYKKIRDCGIIKVFEIQFDEKFSCLSPHDFLKFLTDVFVLKGICVGDGFRFGKNAYGDEQFLRQYGKLNNFIVSVVRRLMYNGNIISSSFIRENIVRNNFNIVKKMS